MLKLVFMFMMLIPCVGSWGFIQSALLLISFFLMMTYNHDFFMFNLGYSLGADYLGMIMILLSVWITILVVFASQMILKLNNFPSIFMFTNLCLCLALILTFSSMDYLMFYIMFESSLIPTLILILGWGYQPERIQAGIYMLFYTLFGSFPLLVSLLSLYNLGGTLTMGLTMQVKGFDFISILWYISTVFAFLVKLPMYFFHLWLPKAHVEAPVAGSMVLAGVMLKLGGYGLIRVLLLFSKVNKVMSSVWVSIGVMGGVMVSLMCLRQIDMKSLIAYSSVAHMGLVLAGLMTMNSWGLNGAVIVMIGHGLCSSGLFCMANMVYERIKSRSLLIAKGLLNFMPSMGLWWFLLSVSNMAAPPSLNLLGEISLIISLVSWSKLIVLGIAVLSFFSASYTIYMYSLSQHGLYFNSLFSCCSGKVMEFFTLALHWVPLNILFLKGPLLLPMS